MEQYRNTHLIEARKAAGLSQKQLARLAGVSRTSVQMYERCEVIPITRHQQRISNTLRAPVEALFPQYVAVLAQDPCEENSITAKQVSIDDCLEAQESAVRPSQNELESRDFVEFLMAPLSEREQEVIRRRFFAEETLAEVGDYIGLTGEAIRRIEDEALTKMRRFYEISERKDREHSIKRASKIAQKGLAPTEYLQVFNEFLLLPREVMQDATHFLTLFCTPRTDYRYLRNAKAVAASAIELCAGGNYTRCTPATVAKVACVSTDTVKSYQHSMRGFYKRLTRRM